MSNSDTLIAEFAPDVQLLVQGIEKDNSIERLRLLSKAQRHDFYYRGIQDIAPEVSPDGSIRWAPVNGENDDGEPDIQMRRINKVRGDGKKFISVLGQKPPNIKAMPADPRSESDRTSSRQADLAQSRLRIDWDTEQKNMLLAKGLWNYGTQFGYTRVLADGERFGYREVPVLDSVEKEISPAHYNCQACGAMVPADQAIEQPVGYEGESPATQKTCPQCGAALSDIDFVEAETDQFPVQVGTKKYPKARVELSITNVMRVRVPFWAQDITDCEYLIYEFEESETRLKAVIPNLRELLAKGTETVSNATLQGQRVRAAAASPTGNSASRKGTLPYARVWLRPSMFESIEDKERRARWYEQFPIGAKMTLVNNRLVAIEGESMDDHWTACPAETSETIHTDAIVTDMIDVQDAVNESLTIGMETFLRGLPLTIVSPDIIDPKTLRNKPPYPGEILIAKQTAGTSIEKSVVTLNTARFPEQLTPFVQMFESEARESTGVRPEIFGGGDGSMTATEFNKRQSQALAQLGMQWLYMRRFWVKTYQNGVNLLKELGETDITAPTSTKTGDRDVELLDLPALGSGNYYFESDESIPQSWGQQKEQLLYLLGQAPMAAQALGVLTPENISVVREFLGLPNLRVPNEDQRTKVLEVIGKLLNEQPIQDPQTGQSKPSIPVDDFDDPSIVSDVARSWLIGDAGRKEQERQSPGFQNVVAYFAMAKAMTQPPQPPPQSGPPQQQDKPPQKA